MSTNVVMVVPAIKNDVGKLLANIDMYYRFLPISQICIIGRNEVEELLPGNDNRIKFVHEDVILNKERLQAIVNKREGVEHKSFRFGWYYQQFLKMAYAEFCMDNYYLLWDSDTIPVKKIELFNSDGKPFFDCKTEYHRPYFETIQKILPGYGKQVKESFISEHMLIQSSYMRELISKINDNNKGERFDEIIINSIPVGELGNLRFSEFETYGTYMTKTHPDAYSIRKWSSMRFGGFFFPFNYSLKEEDLRWLSQHYDAISFEKGDKVTLFSKVVLSPIFQAIFPSSILYIFSFVIRGFKKVMSFSYSSSFF